MRFVYIIFSSFLLFAACNNAPQGGNSTTQGSKPAPAGPIQSRLTTEGTQKLMDVMSRYYALKNAFVTTRAAQADSAATGLATATQDLQALLQNDTANYAPLKPYMDTIIAQCNAIHAIQDETCEKQRIAFDGLSSAMYGLLKHADMKNAGVYHSYCPMAFNNKGAYWLSEESDIKNPYFGDKMLTCGEVTDSL